MQTPNGNTSDTAQIVRANTTNSGNALNIENSGGTGLKVNQSGPGVAVSISSNQSSNVVTVNKNATGAGDALIVTNEGDGFSLLTKKAGSITFAIDSLGLPRWGSSNGQQTVGSSGTASAPPASPEVYLKLIGPNGVIYVVPAYKSI